MMILVFRFTWQRAAWDPDAEIGQIPAFNCLVAEKRGGGGGLEWCAGDEAEPLNVY
jgi:hypothetical protein